MPRRMSTAICAGLFTASVLAASAHAAPTVSYRDMLILIDSSKDCSGQPTALTKAACEAQQSSAKSDDGKGNDDKKAGGGQTTTGSTGNGEGAGAGGSKPCKGNGNGNGKGNGDCPVSS